jgi:ligand-binding sensor domain-containing protein
LTKLNGLPNYKITFIKQDDKGYLWIGKSEGLSRYDGNSFVNYNTFKTAD